MAFSEYGLIVALMVFQSGDVSVGLLKRLDIQQGFVEALRVIFVEVIRG